MRRVRAELVRGHRVSRKRVWRLMRAASPQGRHPRVWRWTTVAGQRPIDAPDLLGQDFTAERADTRWCGDITYVRTVDGWVYTATVIDLHSRKVVGYAVADHLRTSLRGFRRRTCDPQAAIRRDLPQRRLSPIMITRCWPPACRGGRQVSPTRNPAI